jgi:hypothetical protein
MAREFRQDPNYRELDVLLVRDVITGKAGVDYRTVKMALQYGSRLMDFSGNRWTQRNLSRQLKTCLRLKHA